MLMSLHIKRPVSKTLETWTILPDPSQRTSLGIVALSNELNTNNFGNLLTPDMVSGAVAITSRRPRIPTDETRYKKILASQWGSILQCLSHDLCPYLPKELVLDHDEYTRETIYDCFPYLTDAINRNRNIWTGKIPAVIVNVEETLPPTTRSAQSANPHHSQNYGRSAGWQSQGHDSTQTRQSQNLPGAPYNPTSSSRGHDSRGRDGFDYSARR